MAGRLTAVLRGVIKWCRGYALSVRNIGSICLCREWAPWPFQAPPRCTPCASWQTSDDTSTSAWPRCPSTSPATRRTEPEKENGRPPSTARAAGRRRCPRAAPFEPCSAACRVPSEARFVSFPSRCLGTATAHSCSCRRWAAKTRTACSVPAAQNGPRCDTLADLHSSVAVQTWIDADRRYDLAGHAKLANTIRPTIDDIGPPPPGGPKRCFVRPGRLGGSGATAT